MDEAQRQAITEELLALAEQAGERIMAVYEQDFDVETKADDSPLTEADRAAHDTIARGLRRLTPDVPVLSEEGGFPDYEIRAQWPRYWLVDPLDGTKEFVRRNGEFTVNIALIEAGRPVMGVVHAPVLARTWYGVGERGAFVRDADGERAIHTRPAGGEDGVLTLVVSRSHRGAAVDTLIDRLPAHRTTSVGSSLKFCLVAEGKADLYPRFGPTSEWDTAAAQCVVECAGGRVTRVDLTPLDYNTRASVLNPDFLVFGDSSFDWAGYLEGFEVVER